MNSDQLIHLLTKRVDQLEKRIAFLEHGQTLSPTPVSSDAEDSEIEEYSKAAMARLEMRLGMDFYAVTYGAIRKEIEAALKYREGR